MSILTAPSRDSRRTQRGDSSADRHLRVVQRRGRSVPRGLKVFLALVVVAAMAFGSVVVHVHLAQGQRRIDDLNRQAQQAQSRYNELRVEVDRLSAPARVIERARKLGMVTADDPVWLPSSGATEPSGSHDANGTGTGYLSVKPYLQENP